MNQTKMVNYRLILVHKLGFEGDTLKTCPLASTICGNRWYACDMVVIPWFDGGTFGQNRFCDSKPLTKK